MCCYHGNFSPRAIIIRGINAGRVTDLGNDGTGEFDISVFKSSCCGNTCSRYEDKRPLSPIAPDNGGTRGKQALLAQVT